MKKIISLVLTLAVALSLTACVTVTKTETKGPTDTLSLNGVDVTVGAEMSAVYDALGTESEYSEAVSCYAEGYDKVYTYDGFSISTYPDGDKDIIMDVRVTSADITLDSGCCVGSEAEDVTDVYGKDYELSGTSMYKYYVSDGVYMYFYIMDDIVVYYGVALDL